MISNTIKDIWDISQIHSDINAIDAGLKIHDHIKQAKSKWKVVEFSVKSIGKGLHKLFKAVLN